MSSVVRPASAPTPLRPADKERLAEISFKDRFKLVELKCRRLCQEMHVPFLDQKMYEKFLYSIKTEDGLYKLCLLTQYLIEHKKRTLAVLKLIHRREIVVMCIYALTNDYTKGAITTMEVQSKVIRLLQTLRKVTLNLVVGIQDWRELLTRPYPFMFQGMNYLLKVMADNYLITQSYLNHALPLQLYDYPLCSHFSSLSSLSQVGADMSKSNKAFISYPLAGSRKAMGNTISNSYRNELRRAEAYIKQEQSVQQKLMGELLELSVNDCFVPILRVPGIPDCMTGIRVTTRAWVERLQAALKQNFDAVSMPPETLFGMIAAGVDNTMDSYEYGEESSDEYEDEYDVEEDEDDDDIYQHHGGGY